MDAEKKTKEVDNLQNKKIRISITSRNVRNIERCSNELVKKAKEAAIDQPNIQVKGPVRMPTKHLKMTVRKSPCGEGSKTWDRYELRVNTSLNPPRSTRELSTSFAL
jgi:small subunit ribosomal protein S20e